MPDDSQKRGQQDRVRINVNEAYEIAYWTEELGVSEDELRMAVAAAGPMASAVRDHLGHAP